MTLEFSKREPRSWKRLQEHGLLPAIRTPEEYNVTCGRQYILARHVLSEFDLVKNLNNSSISLCHYLIFSKIHLWAGKFRQKVIPIETYIAADPQRIAPELDLAVKQMTEIYNNPQFDPLTAFAFFHVRYERIHPFADGNGRSGRCLLLGQLDQIFSKTPVFTDRSQYLDAMKQGFRGNLAPLINLLHIGMGEQGVAKECFSPFRIAPFCAGDPICTLNDDAILNATRMTTDDWLKKQERTPLDTSGIPFWRRLFAGNRLPPLPDP